MAFLDFAMPSSWQLETMGIPQEGVFIDLIYRLHYPES